MAESSRVQNTPPCTEPIGLYRCSPTSRPNATRPGSTLCTLMPSRAAIGAPGMRPSAIAVRYSRPLRSRASAAPISGSCQVTTRRLNHLVDSGVLTRVAYSEHPPRSEYRLTRKGRDLWHVITAMRQWGDRWARPAGPGVEIRHAACGHVVSAVPACSHCGEPLDARSVTAVPGPGAVMGTRDRAATRCE